MFNKKGKSIRKETTVTLNALQNSLANMDDAEIIEHLTNTEHPVTLVYLRTLIDQERLNEFLHEPLSQCTSDKIEECIKTSKVSPITTLEEAQMQLMQGSIVLHDSNRNQWVSIQLQNPLSRGIQTSGTETVIYGAKDSFSEQIENNITLIRRRLPLTELKAETFNVGYLSKTTVVLMYIEGLTNPEFISIARRKLSEVNFDQFLDSSQVAAFMEDHHHSVFPQFLQTDRPDACAYALGEGKIMMLINNTPFALIAPITFFHLFQSPEDYFLRWPIASFLRLIRYGSFLISLILIPLYVALTFHHYQMIPLQLLYVLLETRSKLPFSPFWEALMMLIILEIIKEASLRMPTKTSQTLGVIAGIVIGQAAVEAGFASKILIVLMGISAIAFFLVPNYLMTKSNVLIQFVFLLLAWVLGIVGIGLGAIVVLAHLNALTSLKQPYLAPVAPFFWKDWNDLFIRGPLIRMKARPAYLRPLQKWRYKKGR
ncbi:spore germination protein [Ammoniphilus sp. CFH 90114]|nr:spore germination protein [Ammoniphilus sp. CFH 90114]